MLDEQIVRSSSWGKTTAFQRGVSTAPTRKFAVGSDLATLIHVFTMAVIAAPGVRRQPNAGCGMALSGGCFGVVQETWGVSTEWIA